MLFLPAQIESFPSGYTEIEAYMAIADLGFPVYKSVVIEENEPITAEAVRRIESYLGETFIQMLDLNGTVMSPKPMRISCLENLPFDRGQIEHDTLWIESLPHITEAEYYLMIEHTENESHAYVWGKGFTLQGFGETCIPPHQKIQLVRGDEFIHPMSLQIEIISSAEYRKSRENYLEKIKNSGVITRRHYHPMSLYQLQQLVLYARIFDGSLHGRNYKVRGAVYDKRIVFDRLYYKKE